MATVFHERTHGRFIDINVIIKRSKLHIIKQDFNLLEGSFQKRANLRVLVHFIGETNYQSKDRVSNQVKLFVIGINKPHCVPVDSLLYVRFMLTNQH